MKFAEQEFPLGTFKKQTKAGAYLDGTLATNLDVLAKKISKDMHFLGLITGHDSVGNGKTTLATQVGSYLTWKINQLHGTNNTFSDKNMVFKGRDLYKVSFNLPKYSVIVLDEGDDLTLHSMKDVMQKIKRYFRKCRQLNQILILILPSFFELPKFFALSRSHFLIDVKFEDEFERGYFNFYGPKQKKMLYLKGKREWDYSAARSDFNGRFFGSYVFYPEVPNSVQGYLTRKHEDMEEDDEFEEKTPRELVSETKKEILRKFLDLYPDKLTQKQIAPVLGVTPQAISLWLKRKKAI